MQHRNPEHPFRTAFSLEPLLDFWRESVTPMCSNMAELFGNFEQQFKETPELQGTVEDVAIVDRHLDIVTPLMSVVFPAAGWDSEVMGALTPYASTPVYISLEFEKRFIRSDGGLKGRFKEDYGDADGGLVLRAYHQIAEKMYGIQHDIEKPIIRIVPDEKTGLNRYFRLILDMRFVEVLGIGEIPELDEKSRSAILENITDAEVLRRYLPPEKFLLRGFVVVRVVDVTESEILSLIERDLIDQDSIFSQDGFQRVKDHLKTLFGRPDLMAGMGALQGDQVMVISDNSKTHAHCIFTSSSHIPLSELQGSVWLQAVEKGSLLRVPDIRALTNPTHAESMLPKPGPVRC